MASHENCLLCEIGWAREHHPEPIDTPYGRRGAWSTEAEDKSHYPNDIGDSETENILDEMVWSAYMEATLDMAIESVWGKGGE